MDGGGKTVTEKHVALSVLSGPVDGISPTIEFQDYLVLPNLYPQDDNRSLVVKAKCGHRLSHRMLYKLLVLPHLRRCIPVPYVPDVVLDYVCSRQPRVFDPNMEDVRFAVLTLKKFSVAGMLQQRYATCPWIWVFVNNHMRDGMYCQFIHVDLHANRSLRWYVPGITRPVFLDRTRHVDDGWKIVFAELAVRVGSPCSSIHYPKKGREAEFHDNIRLRVTKKPRQPGTREAYDTNGYEDI